jgi:hypothetical protein
VLDQKNPFFVVGPSRSGTTLIATVLDNHPEMAILPETWAFVLSERLGCRRRINHKWQFILLMNDIWDYVHATDPAAGLAVAEAACDGPAESMSELLEDIGERYLSIRGGKLWGEKTPPHLLSLDSMFENFPEAAFVRIVRDPRDILASYIKAWNKGANDFNFLMTSSTLILRYFRELLDVDRWRGRRSLLVRYEDFAADSISSLERISDFLGVCFTPEALDLSKSKRAQRLSSLEIHRKLARAVDSSSVGRYGECLDPNQIALVEFVFDEYMQSMDYAPSTEARLTRASRDRARTIVQNSKKIQKGWRKTRGLVRGQARLVLHRLMGRSASVVRGFKIAVTRDEWHRRVNDMTARIKTAGY